MQFETEYDFRNMLSTVESIMPDVILLDIMLRWTNPSPNMPEYPEEVKEEGFYTAGFRCQKILSSNSKLMHIPIIFYTVLDRVDLQDKLKEVPKTVTLLTKDISSLLSQLKGLKSKR